MTTRPPAFCEDNDEHRPPPGDPNVEAVVARHRDRAAHGLKKYGVTTARTDLTPLQWVQHLQDELMDGAVYAERLKGVVGEKEARIAELEAKLDAARREAEEHKITTHAAIEALNVWTNRAFAVESRADALRGVADAAAKIPRTLALELAAKGMPLSSKRVAQLIEAVVEYEAALSAQLAEANEEIKRFEARLSKEENRQGPEWAKLRAQLDAARRETDTYQHNCKVHRERAENATEAAASWEAVATAAESRAAALRELVKRAEVEWRDDAGICERNGDRGAALWRLKWADEFAAALSAPTPGGATGGGTKLLARVQPCGCVVCVCEDNDMCRGCGAKHCGRHPVGQIPNPVYEGQAKATPALPASNPPAENSGSPGPQ